ncbi:MAG: hemerythrin domain-containing protein [Polyangiaceae bacterium]
MATTLNPHSPVSDFIRADYRALGVFERFKIDFTRVGRKSLVEACQIARVPVGAVLGALSEAATSVRVRGGAKGQIPRGLGALSRYIEDTHHVFTKDVIQQLLPIADKAATVCGHGHPELSTVRELVHQLAAEIIPHMNKEERVLFPYLQALAAGVSIPRPVFGSARNPVAVMVAEHDRTSALLIAIEEAARDPHQSKPFGLPADACAAHAALYVGLEDLIADLRQHMILENDYLFPQTLALEAAYATPVDSAAE